MSKFLKDVTRDSQRGRISATQAILLLLAAVLMVAVSAIIKAKDFVPLYFFIGAIILAIVAISTAGFVADKSGEHGLIVGLVYAILCICSVVALLISSVASAITVLFA